MIKTKGIIHDIPAMTDGIVGMRIQKIKATVLSDSESELVPSSGKELPGLRPVSATIEGRPTKKRSSTKASNIPGLLQGLDTVDDLQSNEPQTIEGASGDRSKEPSCLERVASPLRSGDPSSQSGETSLAEPKDKGGASAKPLLLEGRGWKQGQTGRNS